MPQRNDRSSTFNNRKTNNYRSNNLNHSSGQSRMIIDGFGGLFDTYVKQPLKNVWSFINNPKKPNLEGFSKTRKHRPDYQILLFMGLLMMIGLIIMYAIGPQRANVLNASYGTDFYTDSYFFIKQLISLGLSLAVFFVMGRLPLDFLYKNSGKVLIFGYISCLLLAIFGFMNIPLAKCELGACRWYNLGPLGSLQPSEFLKLALLLSLSVFLGAKAALGKINNFKGTLLPAGLLVIFAMIIIAIFQKDLGTAISAIAIVAAQLVMAGLNKKNVMRLGALFLALMVLLIVIAPHRLARIATFGTEDCSQLSLDENAGDYHICHAKIAIGSGGLLGVGIGNSVQATGYLPEAINDSVFAIMGETFGFVGLIVILLLFFALLFRLLKVASHIENPASRVFAAGAFGWLGVHVVMNVSAMIGLIPLTGITLPLLSFGGTSMIFISATLGVVFNISKYTSFAEIDDFKEGKDENLSSRRGIGRPRYSSRRRI
jgi:cell division protein FtsW